MSPSPYTKFDIEMMLMECAAAGNVDAKADLYYWKEVMGFTKDTDVPFETEEDCITEVSRKNNVCVRLVCYTIWPDAFGRTCAY